MKRSAVLPLLLVLGLSLGGSLAQSGNFDIVMSGARVIDGSGNPWYVADVGIRNGVITEIGNLSSRQANRRIDAAGMVLAPGFIDMMGGSTLPLLLNPETAQSKLRQGVTTMMAGEGDSMAPQNDHTIQDYKLAPGSPHWSTFAEYDHVLAARGIGMNVIHNVGATQVRRVVIGDDDVAPTPEQMEKMKALVATAMQDGAIGLSTALIYPPATYARTAEIIELAKVAAQYNGVYFSHMRNESGALLTAIQEVIQIGESAHIPVHIYHLKAAGEDNWPLMEKAIALIESARTRGVDITADVYPYIRNGIGLGSFVHPRHYAHGTPAFLATLSSKEVRARLRRETETTSDWENWYQHVGRNWDNVLVVQVSPGLDKRYEGKSVQGIAEMRHEDVWDTFFDLVQHDGIDVDPKSMDEEQKHAALKTDFVSIDSDAEPMDAAVSTYAHPRTFGTFPRILAKYVREEHVITLEDAIREMTSLPANQLHLRDRGRVSPGMVADLVLFDPDKVKDTATYEKPMSYATGMEYVLVNGQIVIDHGQPTHAMAGKIILANR